MTIVTLYEDLEGRLFLHLLGEPLLWCLDQQTASTFLTDATVLANEDTKEHPAIFFAPMPWEGKPGANPERVTIGTTILRAVAVLQLDPAMGARAAAYTLFHPPDLRME